MAQGAIHAIVSYRASAVKTLQLGLPDGLFSNKNTNLETFWRAFEWKMLLYFMIIWNILWLFGIINLWLFGYM
jgi:hypothetical protein